MEHGPLPTGQLDLLLLSIVAREALHGYAIIERLRLLSGGVFDLAEGTVYPALYRLERGGLVISRERLVGGRTRRVYRVTRQGRAAEKARGELWRGFARSVEAVLRGVPDHA
jgi:DNA-binding PadR family transcriptional regulator